MLPIFNKSIIGDYSPGFDSVDSEDFDPGFGCVPLEEVRVIPGLPDEPPLNWTKSDQENYEYWLRTDDENAAREDEWLKTQGIF